MLGVLMIRMVLSWKTWLRPSGVDESVAWIGAPAAQASETVLLLTGLPGLFGQVTPLKSEGLIFSAPKNSIAPSAPFNGTESVVGLALLLIVRVAVSNVPAGCVDVKTTLTWQVVGAVSVPVHEFPLIAKSAFDVPAPVKFTMPDPWMLTVTVCGALTAGDVPVGTPNDKSVG